MPYKKITTNLPLSADFLFNIVANVEEYPKFVPHCSDVKIISKAEDVIFAQMDIEYKTKLKNIRTAYVSKVELMPNFFCVQITNAEKSLFKELKSSWRFFPSINGCVAEYEISFALQNPVLNITVGSLFLGYTQKIVDAFIQRAEYLSENQKEAV